MLVLYNPKVLDHVTVELLGAKLIPALECPARISSILVALQETNYEVLTIDGNEDEAKLPACLRRTHDSGYLDHLEHIHATWVAAGNIEMDESILPECFPVFTMPPENKHDFLKLPTDVFARTSHYAFDMSSGIMKDTYSCALASAGLTVRASSLLASPAAGMSDHKTIVCLCRPPGHHCDTKHAGGYCYLNNAVVAVESLQNATGYVASDENIAILDIDFHHGNGTQSYFYSRKVTYVSIHGQNEYPYYTGNSSERGFESGRGYNHNFPLARDSTFAQYLATLDQALEALNWETLQYVVVSLGFDTFRLDPLGSFQIEVNDYFKIGSCIAKKTKVHETRTVILLEGGYVLEQLGECLVSFLNGWEDASAVTVRS